MDEKELEKFKQELEVLGHNIKKYYAFYKLDGRIDEKEQLHLDQLAAKFRFVKAAVLKKEKELKENKKLEIKKYTVKAGDTYSDIALEMGVSVEDLRLWNGYEDKQIPIGVELLVQNPLEIPAEQLENEISKKFEEWKQENGGDINVLYIPPLDDLQKDNEFIMMDGMSRRVYNSLKDPENDKVFGHSLGSGTVALKDIVQRQAYIDKTAKTAEKFLKKFEQQVKTDYKQAKQTSIDASNTRNESRKKFQKNPKLSYGAKQISKALDQDRSVAALVRKYGPGTKDNLSGEALRRHLILKSGTTSSTLAAFNKWSKPLGTAGIAVGVVVSAIQIYHNPTFETILGEVSAWVGGAAGASWGMGLAAAAVVALGGSGGLVLAGALAGGMAVGYVVGYISHKVGSWLGSLIDDLL